MDQQNKFAVMLWPTDNSKMSVHSLGKIKEPSKAWNAYKVGDKGKATFPGFKDLWEFEILAVGACRKLMEDKLTDLIQAKENNKEDKTTSAVKRNQEKCTGGGSRESAKKRNTSTCKPNKQTGKENKHVKNAKGSDKKKDGSNKDGSDSDSSSTQEVPQHIRNESIKTAVDSLLRCRNTNELPSLPVTDHSDKTNENQDQSLPQTAFTYHTNQLNTGFQDVQQNVNNQSRLPMLSGVETNVRSSTNQSPFRQPLVADSSSSHFGVNTVQFSPNQPFNYSQPTTGLVNNHQSTGSFFTGNSPSSIFHPQQANVPYMSKGNVYQTVGDSPVNNTYYQNRSYMDLGNFDIPPIRQSLDTANEWPTYSQYNNESFHVKESDEEAEEDEESVNIHSADRSQCHPCCNILQKELMELKKEVEKLKKRMRKNKEFENDVKEDQEESCLINGHTKAKIESAIKLCGNVTQAVKKALQMAFTVEELVSCSVLGQKKNSKSDDHRPGLDEVRRSFLEDLIGQTFKLSMKEVRGKIRDRMKILKRNYSGIMQ